jgi:hypothetical protein
LGQLEESVPELWLIGEPSWSFPLDLQRLDGQDVVGVCPSDIPILAVQRSVIYAKLSSIASYNEGRWWLLESELRKHASHVTGDPESFVTWCPMEPRVEFRTSGENSEFFKSYAIEGVLRDPFQAEIVFNSFCKFMLHWMLNKQKSVDLGFCELCPVPYRPNWYQMILEKDLALAAQVKLDGKHEWLSAGFTSLVGRNIPEHLLDPKLTFWNVEDKHFYWSIAARPKSLWWRMVKLVERARAGKHRGGYGIKVGETLKRMLPQSMRLYASFLQQVRLPYSRLAARKFGSDKEDTVSKTVPPVNLPVSIGTASEKEPSTVLDDVQTASCVSAVSDLQQGKLDVRNPWEKVPEPEHR